MANQFDQPLEILTTIDKVFYHNIRNNVKDLAQSGLLILYIGKVQGKQILSIRIGHFVMTLFDAMTFVKCQYEKVVTYFLVIVDQNIVSSITFDKNNVNKGVFENHLRTHCKTLEVEDLQTNRLINETIDRHWTGFIIKPVAVPDKVQEFISSVGTGLQKGIIKLSIKLRQKFDKNKDQNVINPRNIDIEPQAENLAPPEQPPQPSKWKKFLATVGEGINKASKVANKIINPVIEKGREVNDRLCEKIDKSDNKTLKYMKDLAAVTNDALSNTYNGAKTAVRNKELLYLTVASQNASIQNPQVPISPVGGEQEQYKPLDITSQGLKDSLLNKSYEETPSTPFEQRI